MSLKIHELFGFPPEDQSEPATKFRKLAKCPFVDGKCIKVFKSGLTSGACSLKPASSEPVICCPNRLYANEYQVLLDVAQSCFGSSVRLCHSEIDMHRDGKDVQVFGKKWGKELRLPSRAKGGGYFVDWVLALLDENRDLKEFVAVEIQTMDTNGSYEYQIRELLGKSLKGKKKKSSGINWENVSKRILPQIIYKGHVLRRETLCQKGLFFVSPGPVQKRILERLGGKLVDYSKHPGTVSFVWYDLATGHEPGTPIKLIKSGEYTTTVDQV